MINPTAPKNPGFPLHLFNLSQTKVWATMPLARAEIASCVASRYPQSGAGILSETGDLVAIVQPSGAFRELKPPFTRFQFHQASNAPGALQECACRSYVDLEYGTWAVRLAHETKRGSEHHPFCQFKGTAGAVFQKSYDLATPRYMNFQAAQKRPDEWLKVETEVKKS